MDRVVAPDADAPDLVGAWRSIAELDRLAREGRR
jgi:hypothetical protein